MAKHRKIVFCAECGEDDSKEMAKATERLPYCKSCRIDHDESKGIFVQALSNIEARQIMAQSRLINGEPRSKAIASLRCVADPDESYLGSYFYEAEMRNNLDVGVMPSGSLWINDHDKRVYEILGLVGEEQSLMPVSSRRLKKLEARFPRLKRTLSNPAIY